MNKQILQVILEAKDKASKAINKFHRTLNETKLGLDKLKKAALGLGLSFGGLVYSAKKAIEAYATQEKAIARLSAGLKNVKDMTDRNVQSLVKYANELQRVTTFGDEQIISAMGMLSTFQLNEQQIRELIPRILDMTAALEKSTGAQQDMESVAIAVGKAMTMGVGALTRYGVVISEEAKKTWEMADAQEKIRILTEELDKNFKGIAETVAKTAAGRLIQFRNLMSDLQENIGAGLIPIMSDLVKVIGAQVDGMGKLNKISLETFKVGSFLYESFAEFIRLLSQFSLGLEATYNRLKRIWYIMMSLRGKTEEYKEKLKELDAEFEIIGRTSLEVDKSIEQLHSRMLERYHQIREEVGKTSEEFGTMAKANEEALNKMKQDIRDFRDAIDRERDDYVRALQKMIDARKKRVEEMGSLIELELKQGKLADQDYIKSMREKIQIEMREMAKAGAIINEIEKKKTILTVEEIQKRFRARMGEATKGLGIPWEEIPIEVPKFQKGGIVPGPIGKPTPAIVHGGEVIIPPEKRVGNTYNFNFAGAFIGNKDVLIEEIKRAINRESELRALAGT